MSDLCRSSMVYGNIRIIVGTYEARVIDSNTSCMVRFTDEAEKLMKAANGAAIAFLKGDKTALSSYLADTNYEALHDGAENLYARLLSMRFRLSGTNAAGDNSIRTVTCTLRFSDSDMLSYLDVGLIQTSDGWRVDNIALQG